MLEFHEKFAEIIYNSSHEGVVIIWKDFTTDEEFMKVYENALYLAREIPCKCWIEEMGKGKTVPSASVEWVVNGFFAKLATTEIRKVAFLIEHNFMRNIYAEAIIESVKMAGLQVKSFNTRHEMELWIKEGKSTLPDFTRGSMNNEFNQYY